MTPLRLEGFIGDEMNSAARVASHLQALGGEPAELVVNSPGGDAFEGAAIFAELRAYPAKVTIRVRGIAASAASLVMVAGDEIEIDRAAVVMIHEPSAMTFGPAEAHRATVETLEKLTGTYAAAYAAQTGQRDEMIRSWLAAETWLSAVEAVALGFADRLAEAQKPAALAAFDYSRFRNAPAELIELAKREGWAGGPPKKEHAA